MNDDHDLHQTPPPSRWLYTLVIFMTLLIIAAFLAVLYGIAMTAKEL